MRYFAEPAEGSGTKRYPELGFGPVNYTDSLDPEIFEAEREAFLERKTFASVVG
jgi:hypothetical protein